MTELKLKKGDKVWIPYTIDKVNEGVASPYYYGISSHELDLVDWTDSKLEEQAIVLPTIPKFVADWIEERKEADFTLAAIFKNVSQEIMDWGSVDTYKRSVDFALAYIFGYKIEEKLYEVFMPNLKNKKGERQKLMYNVENRNFFFCGESEVNSIRVKSTFTKKELEDGCFGWVFDNEFAKEVTDD